MQSRLLWSLYARHNAQRCACHQGGLRPGGWMPQHACSCAMPQALTSPNGSQLCHFCLKALPQYAGIPCRACPLAWYCCARHRDLDIHHVPGGPSCGVPWPALLPEHLVLATKLAVMAQVRCPQVIYPLALIQCVILLICLVDPENLGVLTCTAPTTTGNATCQLFYAGSKSRRSSRRLGNTCT